MSEKLKRCSLCEEGEFIPVCDVCGAIGTNTRADEAELAALREENERMRTELGRRTMLRAIDYCYKWETASTSESDRRYFQDGWVMLVGLFTEQHEQDTSK